MARHPYASAGDDGGKVLCAVDALKAPCVIYSLGSLLMFDFESAMFEHTPCEIHTFDCTVDVSKLPVLPARVHFHAICLGDDNPADPRFRSLASLAKEYGHDEIALLKMDIEGFEFPVVESMLRGALAPGAPARLLPSQISFELHYRTHMAGLKEAWGADGLTAGEVALLWVQLADLGYAVISREDNWG
jgi:hypothetical protein